MIGSFIIKSIVTRKLEGVHNFHYYLCRQLEGGGMEIKMIKIKRLIYKILYIVYCFFHTPPKVISTDETLDELVKGECSISRYGDGEFSIIFGQSLPFQKWSPELSKKLKLVLESNVERHLVAIPNVFSSLDDFSENSKKWWSDYLLANRKKIYSILQTNRSYYDSQITRIYINRKNKSLSKERFEKIKLLWDSKKILLVEGEQSRFGVGNDLFDNCKDIKRILVPALNAFEKYDVIYKAILKMNDKYKSDLILLVIGPTATCLAYDLCLAGKRAIDIGNLDMEYEWMKLGAKKQVAINGKYTHEAKSNNKDIMNFKNEKYETEIVLKIT